MLAQGVRVTFVNRTALSQCRLLRCICASQTASSLHCDMKGRQQKHWPFVRLPGAKPAQQ